MLKNARVFEPHAPLLSGSQHGIIACNPSAFAYDAKLRVVRLRA